ncbi:Adrenocortical dysplasia protein like protein [Chelonia mydas]|uniref:Adrenocortical dysplasia protein like protein n=1 Tax=Chelonia mydas TaxID=8469 RepID=M7B0D3_CHEMY|nr:Adrenocortical dysplasia protein like protein [Chelonia mydas]
MNCKSRQVSGLSVCYLQRSTIFQAKNPDRIPECEGMQRLEDEQRWLAVPRVYVLQPWILNLLMKYEQVEPRNTQVPGHILNSSSAQVTMESQNHKRAPAWTEREVLDLIAIWGEESVQAELHSKRQNANIFAKISKGMMARGYNRDTQQCRMKVKELKQAYQRTKDANGHSGSESHTCRFHNELHAILGGAPTTTPSLSVGTCKGGGSRNRDEDFVDEEDEEEVEDSTSRQEENSFSLAARNCSSPWSQYPPPKTGSRTMKPEKALLVVSDLKAADQGSAAVLHVSDGSYYIRVVVSLEAVEMAECVQLQSGFSNIIGRIIILQKYMVCFQEETKAEECEFYLSVHQFIVLPLQRQRMEALNWRGLTLKTISSSGISVSQLMIDIGQRRLKVLKQNVEDCLDLLDPSEVPVIGERLPVTNWEAERKREELSKDVFTVPANFLVISPEEKEAIHDACLADPGAMSRSLDVSLDNPWDKLQSVSVTLSSSLEEKSIIQPSLPSTQEAQLASSAEEAAIMQPDSNTPDFLEPSSQKSPCTLSQGEPVKTVSPSLLSYSSTCAPEVASQGTAAATFQRAPHVDKNRDASHDIPCGQPPGAFQTNLCPFSPALPILGSRAAPPANGGQADRGGVASLPDVGNSGLTSSEGDTELGSGAGGKDRCRSRQHRVTKRKLLVDDDKVHGQVLPSPGKTHQRAQRKPPHADVPMGDTRCMDMNMVGQNPGMELVSAQRAKKSRQEQAGPAQEPALPGDPEGLPGRGNETAAVGSMAASGPGQLQVKIRRLIVTS